MNSNAVRVNTSTDNVVDFTSYLEKMKQKTKKNTVKKYKRTDSLYTIDGRRKPRPADPIKDKEMISAIKEYLLSNGRYGYRNYMIFTVNLNIGRRCGDMLKLKIGDVFENGEVKEEVTHIEEKTHKTITFYLNDRVREALREYILSLKEINPDDYIFKSQKGGKLETRSYWLILNKVQKELELNLHLSTHSMRKTMGYRMYQANKDNKNIEGGLDAIDMIQKAFGHKERMQTLTYVGITKQNLKDLYNSVNI